MQEAAPDSFNPLAPLDRIGGAARAVAGYATGLGGGETVLRIAVTGLSRSGKTVFLTSLLANLLALGGGRDTLPALTRALQAGGGLRRLEARLIAAGSETVPRFDVAAKLRALAETQPEWPPRTEDIAGVSVALAVGPAGGGRGRPRRFRLDFLDYPGEWLLDLPMLGLDFATWSAQTLARLRAPARAEVCADFLAFLAGFDPRGAADEAVLRRGHELYKAALLRLREDHGFRYLQPGRFLCPGPRSDAPYLWFFPCESTAAGAAGALLRTRYDTYRAEVRGEFFATRFLDFDRQIVLVDVLSALHAGRAAFEDTAEAVADIARAFAYGANGFSRLLRSLGSWIPDVWPAGIWPTNLPAGLPRVIRHIERVAYVATKADHVPQARRDNLVGLLRALAEGSAATAAPRGATFHAAAAALSTRDGVEMHGNRAVDVVVGVPMEGGRARAFFPGEVPAGMPPPGFWTHPYFALPAFRPPHLDGDGATGIPHLGLDAVLLAMIGDRL